MKWSHLSNNHYFRYSKHKVEEKNLRICCQISLTTKQSGIQEAGNYVNLIYSIINFFFFLNPSLFVNKFQILLHVFLTILKTRDESHKEICIMWNPFIL